MKKFMVAFCVLLLGCTSFSQQKPASAKKPTKVSASLPTPVSAGVVKMAEWSPFLRDYVGLSQDDFVKSGLGKLTDAELTELVVSMALAQENTVEDARRKTVSYTCGAKVKHYDKVRVSLVAADDSDPEIVSAVRQRIRAISDAEIVFSRDEADLVVTMLAVQNETMVGRKSGFSVSVLVLLPCSFEVGTSKWNETFFRNHFMLTGNSAAEIANRAVSNLDAHYLENVRALHSGERLAAPAK